MLRHIFGGSILLAAVLISFYPASTYAQTASSTTLLYEYWPTQNGEGAPLTATSPNDTNSNLTIVFHPKANIAIQSVCLALDSYNSVDPSVELGVYSMQDPTHSSTLLGRSQPLALTGQYIDWFSGGKVTCFNFTEAVQLTKDSYYTFGVDHTRTNKNGDLFVFLGPSINDPDFYGASSNDLPGKVYESTTDKPYIRIYGEHTQHPVVVIPGILGSWEKNGTWILDPMAHTYDNLVDSLAANGYIKDKTLFTFPYNWEQSNVSTAKELAQKLVQVRSICGCSKVDIVAHSMGGLVAMQYITSDEYAQDVGQLITLGTPFAGSPKAYKMWEGGEIDFDNKRTNSVLERIFYREAVDNGYSSVFEYISKKPVTSVQELLPVKLSYLINYDDIYRAYPNGYPQNPFLTALLMDDKISLLKSSVSLHVVVGNTGTSTPTWYKVKNSTQLPKWPDGEITETTLGQGDGTVPQANSEYLVQPDKTLYNTEHKALASSSAEYVLTQLTGIQPSVLIGKIYNYTQSDWALLAEKTFPSAAEFNQFVEMVRQAFRDEIVGHTVLLVQLYSPVNVRITTPSGAQVGRDFASSGSLAQVPNASYSGPIGTHEYIVITDPMPGTYKVDTLGTGSGAYTVATALITSETSTTSLTAGTTTLNQLISNSLFVSATTTSLTITPPAPIATSTPTTTPVTPLDTCVQNITRAYQAKWIGKKIVYEKLIFDCKALKELFKVRDTLQKISEAKRKAAEKTLLAATYAAIRLTLADMELLAKDKNNTKDAVLLITKITTWLKEHEIH